MSEWIEGTPPRNTGKDFLVLFSGFVTIGWAHEEGLEYEVMTSTGLMYEREFGGVDIITHWMPLPEPPK